MTPYDLRIAPLTPATRADLTTRRAAVGEYRPPVTIAMVEAIGPRDRVAELDGPATVETIEVLTENLAAANSEVPDANRYRLFIRLGEDLTRGQVEAALTALAADGCLPDAFAEVAEAGQHRARTRDDRVGQVLAHAGRVIAATLADDEETPPLTQGWTRYRTHERTGMPWNLGTRLWPTRDLPGLVSNLESHALIALAWDPADPSRAVMSRPAEYVPALTASGERPPLDRPAVVCAAWTAGFQNVRALAEAVGATRRTVYADLSAAGLGRD